MLRRLALLAIAFSFGVAGCGGSSAKPVSVGELRATLARHGVTTYVVFNRQRPSHQAYSAAVPVLVRGFPWRRFVPTVAVIADQRPSRHGSLPGTVRVEGYVSSTGAAAESPVGSCSSCLAARNVVVVARPPFRAQVEAALRELK